MNCPALQIDDTNVGVADALRVVDCHTGQATAYAFGRLFGEHGTLLPALTGLLTLYVAFFAIGLLTGRVRLGLSTLTPRMMMLGLALTFSTSWLAYQNVVWTLATGAPDEVATMLAGTHGSATDVFASRLDMIFQAIADSTNQTPAAAVSTATTGAAANGAGAAGSSLLTPQTLIWVSGLMMLLGTVGVLVTSKVALAALLAVGPIFIIFVIFPGTRGLFEGWLKAVVSFALVPLFTVLIGGATLALISPLIDDTLLQSTTTDIRGAIVLFLAAFVYCSLMFIVVKTASMLVAGWRLPFLSAPAAPAPILLPAPAPAMPMLAAAAVAGPAAAAANQRVRSMVAALPAAAAEAAEASASSIHVRNVTTGLAVAGASTDISTATRSDRRLQGVGSRFRAPPAMPSKARLS